MDRVRPTVYKPGTNRLKTRVGRGFSIDELREAGIDINTARKLGLYIDKRRRSAHKENIEALKKYVEEVMRR